MANFKDGIPQLFANKQNYICQASGHMIILSQAIHKIYRKQYRMKLVDKTLFQVRIFMNFMVRVLNSFFSDYTICNVRCLWNRPRWSYIIGYNCFWCWEFRNPVMTGGQGLIPTTDIMFAS